MQYLYEKQTITTYCQGEHRWHVRHMESNGYTFSEVSRCGDEIRATFYRLRR